MGSVIDVRTYDHFAELIANNHTVVVNFGGDAWCRPCKAFKPHFYTAAEKFDDVVFAHVNIDDVELSVVTLNAVQSVPTVMAFIDGLRTDYIKSRTVIPLINEVKSLGE